MGDVNIMEKKAKYDDLLVIDISNEMSGQYFRREGLNLLPIWKNDHFSSRKYRVLKILGLQYLLFGIHDKNIEKYNKIILGETIHSKEIVEYIHEKNPNCEVVFWFWNPVRDCMLREIENLRKLNIKIFSFDKSDCLKYKFYYNNNLVPRFDEHNFNKKIQYDCFFIGRDKGRLQNLISIGRYLKSINKIMKLIVVKDKNETYECCVGGNIDLLKRNLPYETIIEYIMQSKCIIDIVQEGQSGLTFRPYEALFYNKKLITNNEAIKDTDLYDENNVFVLGKNNMNDIHDFLDKPYMERKDREELMKKYGIDSWIENFSIME